MASEKKSQNDHGKLLALLLFVGAGALVLMSMGPEEKRTAGQAPASVKSEKFEKNVNKHLMLTNENIEMQRRRMEIENARSNGDFNSTKAQATYEAPSGGVDLSTDSRASDVARELGRGDRQEDQPMNPHEVIQKELFNQQQNAEYTQAYKEEYARQFVENARRGGYKVILDDQYRVKQVVPLRRDTAGEGSGEMFDVTSGLAR
ncbi:MAG: hypothetical protein J7501_02515 [Bdellovibrio sp.]|nr:hypothetical protein [Bdellovibrio sp.]